MKLWRRNRNKVRVRVIRNGDSMVVIVPLKIPVDFDTADLLPLLNMLPPVVDDFSKAHENMLGGNWIPMKPGSWGFSSDEPLRDDDGANYFANRATPAESWKDQAERERERANTAENRLKDAERIMEQMLDVLRP